MNREMIKASCIVDSEGRVLYERNSSLRVWPASITKLATAIVFVRQGRLDNMVEISRLAAAQRRLKNFALIEGERIDGNFLLQAMLIQSCNEAAWAAAEAIGFKSFMTKMNQLAKELGMANTHFVNPTGLPNAHHYSTAYDLTRLGLAIRQYPIILKLIGTKRAVLKSATRRYVVRNTNPFLGKVPEVIGGKTGTTLRNGRGLLLIANKGEGDRILVTLGEASKPALLYRMESLLQKC